MVTALATGSMASMYTMFKALTNVEDDVSLLELELTEVGVVEVDEEVEEEVDDVEVEVEDVVDEVEEDVEEVLVVVSVGDAPPPPFPVVAVPVLPPLLPPPLLPFPVLVVPVPGSVAVPVAELPF